MDLEAQVYIDDVRFDVEDTITKGVSISNVMYYVYIDDDLAKSFKASETKNLDSSFNVRIPAAQLNNDASVMRLMARDATTTTNVNEMGLIGSISFNLKQYFKQMPSLQHGQPFTQWITLFDHPEDDEYDGDFGEDDEEEPMIKTHVMVLNPIAAPLPQQQPSPGFGTSSAV